LHGWEKPSTAAGSLQCFGSDRLELQRMTSTRLELGAVLHPALPYLAAEVVWAARHEMARTVEDVLSRRTRALLLDARASIEAAPRVAELLARELGRDDSWRRAQVTAFAELAKDYVLAP
jgi:glycerol-3-phosphate dehydrogenase